MTITYTGKVSQARLWGFSRLLFYWKGSIYKLMYKEMLIFCMLYAGLSIMYRFALQEYQKRIFEKVARHCENLTNLIPLSFVLGFYVAICVTRWWNQFMNIPWPDRTMMYVCTMIDGADERSTIIRRAIMRYLTLASLIVFQATSVVVKKRFPTMDHLLEAGVITEKEVKHMNEIETPHGKWWVPIVWICNVIKEARKEGRIADDYLMKTLIDEVQVFRGNLGMLFSYDWISVPLVYTQVTTLAVYSFFLGSLFGRQFLDPAQGYPGHEVDLYFPTFTLLQFFFYMGWLKVAEQMINPFGEDDDDFEINWVLDRNYQVSLIVVDNMYGRFPGLEKDAYFGEHPPEFMPYTKSSVNTIVKPHMGSTSDVSISQEGMQVVNPMETIPEDAEKPSGESPVQHVPFSPYQTASRMPSPLASPRHGRHTIPNMMSGYHTPGMNTPFNLSKNTIDGTRADQASSIGARHLMYTLNNRLASKTHSYFENLSHHAAEDAHSPTSTAQNSIISKGRRGTSLCISVENVKNGLGQGASTPIAIGQPFGSLPSRQVPLSRQWSTNHDASSPTSGDCNRSIISESDTSASMTNPFTTAMSVKSERVNVSDNPNNPFVSVEMNAERTLVDTDSIPEPLSRQDSERRAVDRELYDILALPDIDITDICERQSLFDHKKSTSDLSIINEKPEEREHHLSGNSSETSYTTPLLKTSVNDTENNTV